MLSANAMKQSAIAIIRKLREHGHQAFLVGGCVRDLVLNREPADYDVATDATPEQVMAIFPQSYAVGAQFGVVLIPNRSNGDSCQEPEEHHGVIEVATFRSDLGYRD